VRRTLAAAAAVAAFAVAAPAQAAAPLVQTMVVHRDGTAQVGQVRASATKVKVGGKTCGVPAASALAALVKLKPGKIGLTDFGECSRSARDASGLYVRSIGSDKARREDGWVYKVGRKAAPAGAADPAGPFGRGPIKAGQRVLWFYCEAEPQVEGCQRTLEVKASVSGQQVTATVKGYDNNGKGVPVENARVDFGGASSVETDAAGRATSALAPGSYEVSAVKVGLVQSFAEEATVR
jgi:hypothetical protein